MSIVLSETSTDLGRLGLVGFQSFHDWILDAEERLLQFDTPDEAYSIDFDHVLEDMVGLSANTTMCDLMVGSAQATFGRGGLVVGVADDTRSRPTDWFLLVGVSPMVAAPTKDITAEVLHGSVLAGVTTNWRADTYLAAQEQPDAEYARTLVGSGRTKSWPTRGVGKTGVSEEAQASAEAGLPITRRSWRTLVEAQTTRSGIISVVRSFRSSRIADRLSYLLSLDEDDPDELPMDTESLRAAASFLLEDADLDEPDIGVGPDGGIGLSWRLDPDGIVSLKFQGRNSIRFSALGPKPRDGSRRIGRQVNVSANEALTSVKTYLQRALAT